MAQKIKYTNGKLSGRVAEPYLGSSEGEEPKSGGLGSAHKRLSVWVVCLSSGFMGPKIEQKGK